MRPEPGPRRRLPLLHLRRGRRESSWIAGVILRAPRRPPRVTQAGEAVGGPLRSRQAGPPPPSAPGPSWPPSGISAGSALNRGLGLVRPPGRCWAGAHPELGGGRGCTPKKGKAPWDPEEVTDLTLSHAEGGRGPGYRLPQGLQLRSRPWPGWLSGRAPRDREGGKQGTSRARGVAPTLYHLHPGLTLWACP